MDYFLCEIFDVPKIDNISNIKDIFDIEKCALVYNRLYDHPRVLLGLAYHHTWLSVFGCAPSKIIVHILCESQKLLDSNRVVQKVLHGFIGKFVNVPQNLIEVLVKDLDEYMSIYKSNSKVELVRKLAWRISPDRVKDNKYISMLSEGTLLNAFTTMLSNNIDTSSVSNNLSCITSTYYKTSHAKIKDANLLSRNPLTGLYLYPQDDHTKYLDLFTCLTPYDAISYLFISDIYWMRSCINQNVIYLGNDAMVNGEDSKLFINTLVEVAQQQTVVIPQREGLVNYDDMEHFYAIRPIGLDSLPKDVLYAVPKVWSNVFIIGTSDLHMFKCGIMLSRLYICFDQNHHIVRDTYDSDTVLMRLITDYTKLETPLLKYENGVYVLPLPTKKHHDTIFAHGKLSQDIMKLHLTLHSPHIREKARYVQNNALPSTDMMIRYFTYLLCSRKVDELRLKQDVSTRENMVILVDNRSNPMSVMSAYISMCNLDCKLWRLCIITSSPNMAYYRSHCPHAFVFTHKILEKKRFDIQAYNAVLKDPKLWILLEDCGAKRCIIIQDDGVIVRKGVESLIFDEKFKSSVAYIGAPWRPSRDNAELASMCKVLVGNGGFSYRDIGEMRKICESQNNEIALVRDSLMYNNAIPIAEDVLFSRSLGILDDKKIGTVEQGTKFSSEQILNMYSYGYHKFWAYFYIDEVQMYIKTLLDDVIV